MKKIFIYILILFSINIYADTEDEKIEYKYIKEYSDIRDPNIDFDMIFEQYSPVDMDNYVFAKKTINIRKGPSTKFEILGKLDKYEKIKVLGLVKYNNEKWYEIQYNNDKAYVAAYLVLKREFDYKEAITRADKIRTFVSDSIKNKRNIYFINKYISNDLTTTNKIDKYGNRENQSIRGYLDKEKSDYINLPDRIIFNIVRYHKEENLYEIKTESYGNKTYFISKADKGFKNSNISTVPTKFIFISRKDQNQITLEYDKEKEKYNVVTTGFVTTGSNRGAGFVTPYGSYIIAYVKPAMLYTGDERPTDEEGNLLPVEVVGEALYAIRFTGGGYMHGIPASYEPDNNREERKKKTASLLGTYAFSHKCVRNQDNTVKFLYDWLGTPNEKSKWVVPETPSFVMVD